MVESSAAGGGSDNLVKIFWMINNSKYDKLREIKGCETLGDLTATPKDIVFIEKMAKAYGVAPDDLYKDSEADIKALKTTYSKIMKKSRGLTHEGKAHMLIVYCGGHGATQQEKQIYLLNAAEAKNAMFQLEFKLRYLIQDEGTLCRIFAVFDCCRCRIEGMPGLLETGRGVAENMADEVDSEEE